VNLASQSAFDRNRGDARHALEALGEVVLGDLAQLDAVVLATGGLEADAHDWRGAGVELEHDRGLGFLGEAPSHAVEAVPDVVGRLIEVGSPRQVQRDAG
jgi:hypothetical protein